MFKSNLPKVLNSKPTPKPTPLYGAACGGACNIIDIFLAYGADLEVEGGEHGTPLMVAAVAGRTEVVKHLVRKGARICYSKDDEIVSAIRKARDHAEIKQWLLVGRFFGSRGISSLRLVRERVS